MIPEHAPTPARPSNATEAHRGPDAENKARGAPVPFQPLLPIFPEELQRQAPPACSLAEIFSAAYRALRPRAPMPVFDVRFYRFTSVNTTIRLRDGKALVRLSDVLEGAPESVLDAIAHILLAKLYRRPIEPAHAHRYRQHLASAAVTERSEQIRRSRGRKRIGTAQGHYYDLEEIFDRLNHQFFSGLLGRPVLTWSGQHARRLLGHYDAAHNTIVISRVFDTAQAPRFAIEYLLYHEMLHLKHPVHVHGGRRCVHSREFQRDERLFPDLEQARKFLKTL
ncbi:MAG: SprT-like domain-containing protein [Acidobacteriaceae bacterium]